MDENKEESYYDKAAKAGWLGSKAKITAEAIKRRKKKRERS